MATEVAHEENIPNILTDIISSVHDHSYSSNNLNESNVLNCYILMDDVAVNESMDNYNSNMNISATHKFFGQRINESANDLLEVKVAIP